VLNGVDTLKGKSSLMQLATSDLPFNVSIPFNTYINKPFEVKFLIYIGRESIQHCITLSKGTALPTAL